MHTLLLKKSFKYDGSQLAPLYNYLQHGVLGDSMVAWVGECDIPFDHMIDGEDLRESAEIAGKQMLHLVLEMFQFPLAGAVSFQRLMGDLLIKEVAKYWDKAQEFQRQGDDIYWGEKKLNISVATCSSNSSLIHFGINISNEGTPVETCSLQDFGVSEAHDFALSFMDSCKQEFHSIKRAMVKVRAF